MYALARMFNHADTPFFLKEITSKGYKWAEKPKNAIVFSTQGQAEYFVAKYNLKQCVARKIEA